MADVVDQIIAELIVKNEAYVRGFNEATAAHERFLKSTTALKSNTFDLQAEGQKYKAGADAISGAEEQLTQKVTRTRKARVDAVKQSGNAEVQAEIATQQRITQAVEAGIAARDAAIRKGSGTRIGATVPGRANNARQGLLTGVSGDALVGANAAEEKEVNAALVEQTRLQAGLTAAKGTDRAIIREQLADMRTYNQLLRAGLDEQAAAVELDRIRAARQKEQAAQTAAANSAAFGKNAVRFGEGAGLGRAYGSTATVAGIAVAAGAGIAIETIKNATDYARALTDVSKAAGISAEALQVYQRAAVNSGAKSTDFDTAISQLSDNLGKARTGAEQQGKAFAALGINIKNSASAGDLLPTLIDRISSISDQSKRAAVETALFGEAGRKLDGLLSGGNQKVSDLAEALERTGSVLSSADVARLNQTAEKLAEVKAQLQVDFASIVANNAQSIIRLADAFARITSAVPGALAALDRFQQRAGIAEGYANKYFGYLSMRPLQVQAGQREVDQSRSKLRDLQDDQREKDIQRLTAGAPSVADQMSAVQAGSVNNKLLDSLNAPKGRKGPDLERQATERQKYIDDTLARYQNRELEAQKERTANVDRQTQISYQELALAEQKALDDIAANGKLKKLSGDQIKNLQDAATRAFDTQRGVLSRQHEIQDTADALDAARQSSDIERQDLENRKSLAQSSAERKRIDLLLLANEQEAQRVADQPILDDEARPISERRYSDQQIADAKARAAARPAQQAQATALINRQDAGPLQDYLNSLPDTADKIGEAFQQAEVKGLQGFNTELGKTISGFLKLHGIAGEFLDDIIQIGIKWAEAQLFGGASSSGLGSGGPLGGIFGGGSGGSGGGLLSIIGRIFGGAGGSAGSGIGGSIGGSFLSGNSILGGGGSSLIDTALLALPGLAGGGSIGVLGNGGVDRNVMSINGQPVARINHGETINVVPNNMRANAPSVSGPVIHQTIRYAGAVDIADRNYVNQVAAAQYEATQQAIAQSVGAGVRASPRQVAYDQRRGAS